MFTKGIAPKTRRSLALLGNIDNFKQFYLAGGTAIALRLGHRLSFDLDFFSPKDFNQKELMILMEKRGKFQLDQTVRNTLLGFFENTKVSFFKYDYPIIDRINTFDNVRILGEKDLMAMKIDAISNRGKKRDFIDLYFLAKKHSLNKAFSCYKEKYKHCNINLLHSLRSLYYFIDAESEKDKIIMLKNYDWEKIKKYFLVQVPKVFDAELKKIK